MTIRERLGDNYESIVLKDDPSCTWGGVEYEGETLGEFMDTIEMSPDGDYETLIIACKICGIKCPEEEE